MRRIFIRLFFIFGALLPNAFADINLPAPANIYLPPPAQAQIDTNIEGFRKLQAIEGSKEAAYPHPYQPVLDPGADKLPNPEALPINTKKLTLNEAIALALRNNPNVQIAELQRIEDKYAFYIAKQAYGVVWSPLTVSSTLQNGAYPQWSVGGGAQVTASSGTNVAITPTTNLAGGTSTQLSITQPLLQNFGAEYNDVNYFNAVDTEKVNQLNFRSSVITVVVTVIQDYRALVAAYNTLATNRASLKLQEQSVEQTKLEVKTGRVAPSDLLEQEANLEPVRLSVVQDQQALAAAQGNFLISIGLVPTANITIDQTIPKKPIPIGTLKQCIKTALKYNVAYQQALLNLKITKRALITANNARKWTLNLTSQVTLGSGGLGTNPNVGLSLSVPIDNVSLKSAVESAKISTEDAKLTLTQAKETLISTVVTQWQAVGNDLQQIQISQKQIDEQTTTLKNAELKLKYGMASMFEVNTDQDTLLQSQVSIISTYITYLNDMTTLHQTMGIILHDQHIALRY